MGSSRTDTPSGAATDRTRPHDRQVPDRRRQHFPAVTRSRIPRITRERGLRGVAEAREELSRHPLATESRPRSRRLPSDVPPPPAPPRPLVEKTIAQRDRKAS
ncbi:MAG: hypothetical protein ACI8Y4_003406 [Candidatus Poriferisodalaceae bacterium]|jgi:hypothetical protein